MLAYSLHEGFGFIKTINRSAAQEVLSLPLFPELSDVNRQRVSAKTRECFG
jgi:hypothetical protein